MKPRRRWLLVTLTVVLLAAFAAGGVLLATHSHSSPAKGYLKTLQTEGLISNFSSDANAVAHAKAFCGGLEGGAPQQGLPADQVAVNYYCPKFSDGFKVLRTATVSGSFELIDSGVDSSIDVVGSVCNGTGGYSDITDGTTVLVKNDAGKLLAETTLGPGSGTSADCTFHFSFSVTEGATDYVVTISHRGEQHYTFAQLKTDGLNLTLGT